MARKDRRPISIPTAARIVPGCRVGITGGRFRGQAGKALLYSSAMWLVQIDSTGQRVNLHRTILKRIDTREAMAA